MTELSFLIDLLLNQDLGSEVKTIVADRIKLLDSQRHQAPQVTVASQWIPAPAPATEIGGIKITAPQSASTMANLAKEPGVDPKQAQTIARAAMASKRVIGGEVNTGNGTRGPRKF